MSDLSKNLSRWEFSCRCGCGFDTVDTETLSVIQDVRDHFGQIVNIISGCRCYQHNKNEGGSDGSQHTYARGTDFEVENVHADTVSDYLEDKYPGEYGIGRYIGRTHLDTKSGPARRWDKR